MKKLFIAFCFLVGSISSFAQSVNGFNEELGKSNSVIKMNGRWIYTKRPTYSSADSGLVYAKYQVDSAIAVNTGGASLSYINGGNSFGGFHSILGNNDSVNLDIFTDGLRRGRFTANGYFYIGDSATAILAGSGNLKILGNTVFGYQAGISFSNAAVALNNTAFGGQALKADSSGYSNSAFGNGALRANLSGYQNSAIGQNALASNTTGYSNMAIGTTSLNANTTGFDNVGIGYTAVGSNTSGHDNIGIGANTLGGNGNSNIAIGSFALQSNVGSSSSVAIGNFSANKTTTSTNNTSIGYQSLYQNTTGSGNTAIGFYAGLSNVVGYGNVFIGAYAGDSATGNGGLYIGDSTNRNLVYGNFITKQLQINGSGPHPSFLSTDNFEVNGDSYFGDSIRLNVVKTGTSTMPVLVYNTINKTVDTVAQSSIGGGGSGITQLTGDGTAGPGSGSQPFTLTTVNSSTGTFGSASSVGEFAVNGKGLITGALSIPIVITEGQVTNLATDLAAKQASLSNAPSGGYPVFVSASSVIRELFAGSNITIDSTTNTNGLTISSTGGGATYTWATAVNTANYTVSTSNYINLVDLTGQANRNIILPSSPTTSQYVLNFYNNSNVSAFTWTFTTATVKDAANNTITTLSNNTNYHLVWDTINSVYRIF